MPARQFRADTLAATVEASKGNIGGVRRIKKGDDGEIVLEFSHHSLPESLHIRLLATNEDVYPQPCGFLVFTDNEHVSKEVLDAMKGVQKYAARLAPTTILDLAKQLDKVLSAALKSSPDGYGGSNDEDTQMTDVSDVEYIGSDSDNEPEDEDEDEDELDEDDDFYYDLMSNRPAAYGRTRPRTETEKQGQRRIIRSLQRAKDCGYRVGILAGCLHDSHRNILSLSIRISKLGLPDEALQAWDLPKSEYLVLLLEINGEYPFMELVQNRPARHTDMKLKIGKCAAYKPTYSQARAFLGENKDLEGMEDLVDKGNSDAALPLTRIFLSRSLDEYLSTSFVSLVKLRLNEGLTWDEANENLLVCMGQDMDLLVTGSTHNGTSDDDDDDDLSKSRQDGSIPLIAMQFARRCVVNCTKYCLRCHRPIESGFESLKPFVCSDPLCLFQYVQMGLGPSIEHEILSQPSVIDLLVSFAYHSVQGPSVDRYAPHHGSTTTYKYPIRTFPSGQSLMVPALFQDPSAQPTAPSPAAPLPPPSSSGDFLKVQVESSGISALIFDGASSDHLGKLRLGKWFALLPTALPAGPAPQGYGNIPSYSPSASSANVSCFGKITDVDLLPHRVGFSLIAKPTSISSEIDPSLGTSSGISSMVFFDVDLDDLQDSGKAQAMRFLLDTLPTISSMKAFLENNPGHVLRSMPSIIPQAATLLEWIVATNRSLIFPIEDDEPGNPAQGQPAGHSAQSGPFTSAGQVTPPAQKNDSSRGPRREKIEGMSGFSQFIFLQGSIEKESRFRAALEGVKAEGRPLPFPTIFAWHGSSLACWHSIIRTGLDFNTVAHGRAYGNGVYFSQSFETSQAYLMPGYANSGWPQSELNLTAAIALSEIINIPDRFISRTPHLVVQDVDWQQCRYLFVQKGHKNPNNMSTPVPSAPSGQTQSRATGGSSYEVEFIKQDPSMPVIGPNRTPLQIPVTAMPASRLIGQTSRPNAATSDEILEVSDDEDEQDAEFFRTAPESVASDDTSVQEIPPPSSSMIARPRPPNLLDFQPGALDLSALPRIPPLEGAVQAGKHLAKEIANLQRIQSTTPLWEIGWYCPELDDLDNMFQLVVELHSFERDLPLAQDMAKAGISSIALEVRFGPSYPFTPPFVRVVSNRFVPFAQMGGGNITAGGSVCMDLLTSSGWSPAYSIESVILQVRLAITSTDPRPARLDLSAAGRSPYGIGEAVAAYIRAANTHGWQIPEDVKKLASAC